MQSAGRGIRKLVSLFAPVSAIVYEFDRRNKMMEDGLEEPIIDPTDKKAAAAKKEYVVCVSIERIFSLEPPPVQARSEF